MSGQSRTWRVQWWAGSGVYHLHVGKCAIALDERAAAIEAWTGRRDRGDHRIPRTRSGTVAQAQTRGLARCGECAKMERAHDDTAPTRPGPIEQHGAEPGRSAFTPPIWPPGPRFVSGIVDEAERRLDTERRR